MSDLKIQGVVEMSSEGTERAFDRVGQKAEQMAQNVERSAKKAGSAADNIGSNAEKSAEGFTRAEGKIVSSIKRATTQLENFGKTASQRLELQIDTRNLDRAKFEPYLAKLRELESAQGRIVTSSAGMSSSLDNVGRGLSGLAMAAAAAAGVASLGAVAGRLVSVQREFDVLNASLVTVTGSSANAAKEFAWIKEFAATTPFGLNEVTQAFVRMKALGLDATREALISYGNTASAMGKSLEQMIEAVADASTGEFERLKEFGIRARKEGERVSLTFQGVTKTIGNNAAEITKYLQEIGNVDFAGAMTERAKTLDGAISNLGDSWDELFRTVNQAGVGSVIYESVQLASRGIQGLINNINALRSYWQQTEQQQVDSLVAERSRWQESLSGARPGSFQAVKAKEAIEEINGEIRRLQESFERQQYAATQAADQTAKAMKPAGEAVAGVGREARSAAREAERLAQSGRDLVASLVGQSAGLSADFFKKWETLGQAYQAGAISLQDLTDAQAALLAQQPAMKQAAKDAEGYGKALASTVGALEQRALALESELATYGLTKSEIERTTIARLEEVRAMAAANGATDEYLRNVDREIEARKRIASATAGIEVADANKKAAEKAAQEWERTANAIEDALIDALMAGGKSGAEYIEGLFRSMVLRPVLQAIVAPIAGQITGAMGFGGTAGGSGSLLGGISSPLSAISNASQAFGLVGAGAGFTSIAQAGLGGWLSASGSLLGTGTAAGIGAGLGLLAGPIGGALALASLFGAFDKKPSDKSAWATINPLTGALTDVGSMTGKKDPGQQARDQTAQLAQFLAGFAADAGINRALTVMTGQRDGFRVDLAGGLRTPTAPRGNGGLGYNFGAVGEDAFKRILNDLVDEGTLPQATINAWRQLRTDAQGAARDAQEQMDVLDLLVQGVSAAEIERANTMQQAGETLAAAYARMVAVENAIRAGISEAFDSPAERLAAAFQSLGVTIPQTAEAYEQIVRSQDLTTEAGRNLAVSLLQAKALWDEAQRQQELSIREAQTALERAYSGEAGRLSGVIDQFVSLSDSLKGFRDSLNAQSLGEQTRATLAAQQFRDVSTRAQLGDVAAMESLASVSTEYLETVRNSASSAEDYARALAQVQAAVGGSIDVADRQSAIAQAQLDALTAQVGALIDIDDSVLSVRDAIIALQNVMAGNPATATQSQTVASSATLSQQQAGAVIAQSSDTNQTANTSIGFVTSETLVTELQALRAEVIELRASAESTARNTHTTQRILDRVTRGGDAMLTEVAA